MVEFSARTLKQGVDYLEETEAVKMAVAGHVRANPVFAHQGGGVGVVEKDCPLAEAPQGLPRSGLPMAIGLAQDVEVG